MVTYSESGVDIDLEAVTVDKLASKLKSTLKYRDIITDSGHYAALVRLGDKAIAMSTDGVGSKILIAKMMNKFDTVGIDCIAMVVNDILCVGAEPIALVDYLAVEEPNPEMASEIAEGLVKGAIESKIDASVVTCTGKTIAENISDVEVLDSDVIHPIDNPVHADGGIAILKGNIAPNGSVVKKGAVAEDLMYLKGPAKVFTCEEDVTEAIFDHKIEEGDIIVIAYEGPKGGPGMREMLNPTSAIVGMGIKNVGLITDGRFSGGTRGPCIGHVSPEAMADGPIAAIEDGDIIEIDIENRSINVELTDEEIAERLAKREIPKKDVDGWLALYRQLVSSADKGAILK